MAKHLVLASVFLLGVATATAQERPPSAQLAEGLSHASSGSPGIGSLSNSAMTVGTWNWYKPIRTWHYYNGTSDRLWMDMQNANDWIEVAADSTKVEQPNLAAVTDNWLGIWWTSTSTWTSSQLWYY